MYLSNVCNKAVSLVKIEFRTEFRILKGYLAITLCSQSMCFQRLKNARNTPDTLELVMLLSL